MAKANVEAPSLKAKTIGSVAKAKARGRSRN